jgi:beta-lactamase class A
MVRPFGGVQTGIIDQDAASGGSRDDITLDAAGPIAPVIASQCRAGTLLLIVGRTRPAVRGREEMNWFWLRSRRRVASAGSLPHGRAGRLAGRTAAGRILCAGLSGVLAVAVAGCTGSPGGTGQGRATTAAVPAWALISRTVPDAPVGRQLTWLLGALADLPLSQQVIRAHFDSGALAHISAEQFNSALAQPPAPGGASLIGLLSEGPVGDPVSLLAVAAFGSVTLTVDIAVDRAGLIDTLLFEPYQPPPASWAQADRELAGLAPDASLLAARVSPGGSCTPAHQVAAGTARPLGSIFKLFVLGALGHQIAAGRVSWNQPVTVTAQLKSLPSGQLQNDPDGTQISVLDTAAKMISISDNTAADMLINLVGRSAVEAQDQQWSGHAALNLPFLTTREVFILKLSHWPALANRYIAANEAGRRALLTSTVDRTPLPALAAAHAWTVPRDIDTLEWFASPEDICRAFAGLRQLASRPGLAPLGSVLSANDGGAGLDPARWPTVWFKGGSEPGVATLGYLATNSKGQTFVVVAMLSDPAAVLPPSAEAGLLAIVQGAFHLVR